MASKKGTFPGAVNAPSQESKQPLMQDQNAPVVRVNFASVSLHMRDRLRFVRFPESQNLQIYEIVRQGWTKGIKEVRDYDASHEIQLQGNPWAWNTHERTDARRLIRGLLQGLYDLGWILEATVNISKKWRDKDTLIFRPQSQLPPLCTWLCIGFEGGDMMHVLNPPAGFQQTLTEALGSKVQRSQYLEEDDIFEIKFRGYPWRCEGPDTVQTRVIGLILLECLAEHGFSLYASVNQDNTTGSDTQSSGGDTWYCKRPIEWTPAPPTYQ